MPPCQYDLAPLPSPDYLHHPFYCEENVFHLCAHPSLAGHRAHAVVASGTLGGFVMWHQRAARTPVAPLFWDYHVFLLASEPWQIWDLDSTLGLPVPAAEYLARSFRPGLPEELAPIFRVMPAAEFVAALASDRSHMRRSDGSFQRPPPPWPPISAKERGSNLHRFIDMSDDFAGAVMSLGELSAMVARSPARPPRAI